MPRCTIDILKSQSRMGLKSSTFVISWRFQNIAKAENHFLSILQFFWYITHLLMVHYAVNTYQVLSYFCIKHVFYFIYSDALTFRCFDTWGLADPGASASPRFSQFLLMVKSSPTRVLFTHKPTDLGFIAQSLPSHLGHHAPALINPGQSARQLVMIPMS